MPTNRTTGEESRDWRLLTDLAALLTRRARKLYADEALAMQSKDAVYCQDATTIDRCLRHLRSVVM